MIIFTKILCVLLYASTVWAGHSGIFTIKGDVLERDQCDIRIKQSDGSTKLLPILYFGKFVNSNKKLNARMTIGELNKAFGNKVAENDEPIEMGGGSSSRNCTLRNKVTKTGLSTIEFHLVEATRFY